MLLPVLSGDYFHLAFEEFLYNDDIIYIEFIIKNNQPTPKPLKTKAVGLSPAKAPGGCRDLKHQQDGEQSVNSRSSVVEYVLLKCPLKNDPHSQAGCQEYH